MSSITFRDQLEKCKDYGDVFEVVKRAVKQRLNRERAGLMLYLGDLPDRIDALKDAIEAGNAEELRREAHRQLAGAGVAGHRGRHQGALR